MSVIGSSEFANWRYPTLLFGLTGLLRNTQKLGQSSYPSRAVNSHIHSKVIANQRNHITHSYSGIVKQGQNTPSR